MSEQGKKIALITGANKGIGLETARQLGKLGITVLLGSRDAGRGEAAAKVLRDEGLDVRAVKLDLADYADHKAVAALIEKEFGVLDILVNNAGVMIDGDIGANDAIATSEKVLRETFDVNFFALIALTQMLLPAIQKSAGGRIVNLSSILASNTLHATPGSPIYAFKHLAYDASKSALNAFTTHLAYALGDTKIKVNSAHPGWVKTDLGGPGAMMEIVDGAKTSVELATLPEDGPTSGYFHLGEALPW